MARRFKKRRRFRYRRSFRKRYGRRRFGFRRGIRRLFRKVNKISRSIEYKNTDSIITLGGPILNDGLDYCGLVIPQGDTSTDRIGRYVMIHRVSYGGYVRTLSNGTPDNLATLNRVRVVLFLDKVCDTPGTPPALAQLYDSYYTNPTFAYRNRDEYKKYKVLYDKVWNMPPVLTSTTDTTYSGFRSFIPFKFNFKFRKGLKVSFIGSATTPNYNNLWLMFFSDIQSQTNKNYPSIPTVYQRVVYSDA